MQAGPNAWRECNDGSGMHSFDGDGECSFCGYRKGSELEAENAALRSRIEELEEAIREHRSTFYEPEHEIGRGDAALYAVLREGKEE